MILGYKEVTKMKKSLATILALILVISAVFGVSVMASADATGASLGYANINYGDQISLVFTVKDYTGGGTVGIAVYKNEADAKPMYTSFDDIEYKVDEENVITYYETFGIAAKDIDTYYYVAVAEKDADGNVTAVSAKTAYSVKTYAETRLSELEFAEETEEVINQKALYNAILAYNAAADAVFTPAN